MNTFFNRSTDLFARYGGEEFVAVMPFTPGETAVSIAEKILQEVIKLDIPNHKDDGSPVTVSIGLSSRRYNQVETSSQLVVLADNALYHAKRNGRNRVECDFFTHNAITRSVSNILQNASHQISITDILNLLIGGADGYLYYYDVKKDILTYNPLFQEDFGLENDFMENGKDFLFSLLHENDVENVLSILILQ